MKVRTSLFGCPFIYARLFNYRRSNCRSQIAREKGRNVKLYTVLGIIPIVHNIVLLYLIGASNNIIAEKGVYGI